jgi:hypothetical protein
MQLRDEISLDGRLDESIWQTAPAVTSFVQREPNEGRPATQLTEIRFAYDDANLYVGARMYDELGAEGVVSRLVRRDAHTQSDRLTIMFDTFHDHTGQTLFSINPAGVRGDAFGHDDSWDPVWRAHAQVDSLGPHLPHKIPQLCHPALVARRLDLRVQPHSTQLRVCLKPHLYDRPVRIQFRRSSWVGHRPVHRTIQLPAGKPVVQRTTAHPHTLRYCRLRKSLLQVMFH